MNVGNIDPILNELWSQSLKTRISLDKLAYFPHYAQKFQVCNKIVIWEQEILTSLPHAVFSSYPQLMTWIASLIIVAGLVESATPPFSISVDSMNTEDMPKVFSKLICEMSSDLLYSS